MINTVNTFDGLQRRIHLSRVLIRITLVLASVWLIILYSFSFPIALILASLAACSALVSLLLHQLEQHLTAQAIWLLSLNMVFFSWRHGRWPHKPGQ